MNHPRLLAMAACLVCAAGLGRADFHVSPHGSDAQSGTAASPFATPERARTAIRDLKRAAGLPPGGVTVWFDGGVYERTNTFDLAAEDSGTPDAPVQYRGRDGTRARLVGGARLDPSWFVPVPTASAIRARLDDTAGSHIVQADLAARGLSDYGTLAVRGSYRAPTAAMELVVNGEPMPLARWPDPDEDMPRQTATNAHVNVFGTPVPDVTGRYAAIGTSDGVNAYRRDGLVDGRQYHLYRNTWNHDGRTHTA